MILNQLLRLKSKFLLLKEHIHVEIKCIVIYLKQTDCN